MEIEEIKEIWIQSEQVPDLVKLEEKDNQPQVQVRIENSDETCVKLEEIENELPFENATFGYENCEYYSS